MYIHFNIIIQCDSAHSNGARARSHTEFVLSDTIFGTVTAKFYHEKKILSRNREKKCAYSPFAFNFTPLTTHTHKQDGTRWKMNLNFIAPLWQRVFWCIPYKGCWFIAFRKRAHARTHARSLHNRINDEFNAEKLLHFKLFFILFAMC